MKEIEQAIQIAILREGRQDALLLETAVCLLAKRLGNLSQILGLRRWQLQR